MKKALLIFTLLLLAVAPLHAAINAFDRVPGATLLMPYFEVDLAQSGEVRTTFTVGNSGSSAVVAHVTLWTDRGVPTQTFDLQLGAYDIAEVDLGQIFWNGTFPQTSAGSFPSCSGTLPPAPLSGTGLTALRNAHQGLASSLLSGNCGGYAHGDNRARGFVTIDVTNACTALNPKSPGYFVSGGAGIATNQNVLWGESSNYHTAAGFAHGEALVSLEADAADPLTNGDPADYTFYRRMTGSSADNREALGHTWSARFANAGTFTHTRAIIWRDPGPQADFGCNAQPLGIPLEQIVVFDEQEEPSGSCGTILPLATQAIELADTTAIDVPWESGFVYYNLSGQSPTPAPSELALGTARQAYVTHVLRTASTAGQISGNEIATITETSAILPTGCNNTIQVTACSDGVDNDGDTFVDFPNDPHCWGPEDHFEDNFNLSPGARANFQCDDGLDNDLDGLFDFPDDPNCFWYTDDIEAPGRCSDGLDNDADGKIDFGTGPTNDPGCSSASDNFEEDGPCSDGVDNDLDGLTDLNDPGCANGDSPLEDPQCNDATDNDLDGFNNYPADSGCSAASDNLEQNAVCNDGIDNDSDGKIDFGTGAGNDPGCSSLEGSQENPQCDNGIDDDGDGFIDYPADLGCVSRSDTNEFPVATQCSDGLDNDGNGRIDYPNDPGCSSSGDDEEVADCGDGLDNDGDGLVDFGVGPGNDPGCASATDQSEFAGTTLRGCSDGIDNDGDGLRDYPQDPGCSSRWDDIEYAAGDASAPQNVNVPALSPFGMILAAALLALVAAIALRGTSLG